MFTVASRIQSILGKLGKLGKCQMCGCSRDQTLFFTSVLSVTIEGKRGARLTGTTQ